MAPIKISKIFVMSLFFTIACTKENIPVFNCSNPTSDIAKSKSIIIGKWTWAYEKYLDRFSQSYIIRSPQTESYTRQYEFLKNSDVKIFKNQNLIETASYEVTTLNVVTGSDMDKERTILLFKSKSTGQRIDFSPILICSDTLTLNYQAYSDTQGQEKWSKN
jgi:hypothetical protein